MASLRRVLRAPSSVALVAVWLGTTGCGERSTQRAPAEVARVATSEGATPVAAEAAAYYGIRIHSDRVVFVVNVDRAASSKRLMVPPSGHVLETTDDGKTWNSLPGEEHGFAVRATGEKAIYAAVRGEMYESSDDGASWVLVPTLR